MTDEAALDALAAALTAYRNDRIDTQDRSSSWRKLDVLLGACEAVLEAEPQAAAAMERDRLRTNFKVGWDAMTPAERSHLRVYGIDRLVAKLLADPTP